MSSAFPLNQREIPKLVGSELTDRNKEKQYLEEQRKYNKSAKHLVCCDCTNTSANHKFFEVVELRETHCQFDPEASYGEDHYKPVAQVICKECYLKYLRSFQSAINESIDRLRKSST